MKIISGMFRNVPACSGMFRVPGFIDGLKNRDKINLKTNHSGVSLSIKHNLELSTGKLKLAFLLLNTVDIR